MGITGSTIDQNKYFGFRLYKIFPEGPLAISNSSLTELDEFIIPPEEVLSNEISFYEYVKNNLNKPLRLNIYSTIRRFIYTIEVIPRNDWGDPRNGFLGACVRYENWATAHANILRVIKVKEDSVADKCLKLKPLEDYIISLRPENKDFVTLNQDNSDPLTIFHEILMDNIANFVEIFIFNVQKGPRSIKIFLEQNQGEILGCDVAYGKLHELPKINDEENDKERNFDNSNLVNDKEERKKEDFILEETKKILKDNLIKKEKSGEIIKENNISNIEKNKEDNNPTSLDKDKATNIYENIGERNVNISTQTKDSSENLQRNNNNSQDSESDKIIKQKIDEYVSNILNENHSDRKE